MKVSVCVPYRSDGDRRDLLWSWVQERWRTVFPDFELSIGVHTEEVNFNISKARNRAAAASSGDILIIADTDVVPERLAVRESVMRAERGEWLFAFNRYYNADQEYTDKLLKTDPFLPLEEREIGFYDFSTSTQSGCLVIRRDDFFEVGGFDVEFKAWGPEDVAFCLGTEAILNKPHGRADGFAVHLWHPRYNDDWPSNPDSVRSHKRLDQYKELLHDPLAMRRLKGDFKC